MNDRAWPWPRERWRLPTLLLRLSVFVIVAGLGLTATGWWHALTWCALLAAATIPGTLAPAHPVIGRLGRVAEVAVVVLGTASAGDLDGWMLPYLTVPLGGAALFGGAKIREGLIEAAGLAVLAAGGLATLIPRGGADFAIIAVEWIALAVLFALTASWLRRALQASATPGPQPYEEATALLTQLRAVARQLPGGTLDPGGIATHLLDEVRGHAAAERSAVLTGGGGNRLVILAQNAPDRVDWETSLENDSALADAWAGQQPQTSSRSLSRSRSAALGPVSVLVVPLVAGVRTVGLIVMETDQGGAYTPEVIGEVADAAAAGALRLETALLFDEVRSLATTEERQRLAREIHDGVAQELAMVGYGIDNALGLLPPQAGEAAEELRDLRTEVTRLITELRLSLFELRSEVDRHGGLTAAIADYARTVGASAGLRVHLSLDESTARLPAATEAELLRIAQESITNARKHARADNLWVTCEVDPPYARIEVSDDGRGISGAGADGRYGLTIMSERAERIRASLEIRPREPHGTTVAVILAAPTARGSVHTADEN
ncbi:hypothetical protein Afil01_48600 [Actinorhabdospora filicis]|uniref:Histidine kinase/HSP90-like ATPase domain-containing protein n=1 Tax=Actinorhabdospora filicis TaxID=1785913 RepID=A0A9W6SQ36_9ACTN|nr:sensor histidine kinase [Actinorhabdospora filicis]GLZ80053.1 hypothetical protein Afil01_48600 [Actinorhabdospora filicis]